MNLPKDLSFAFRLLPRRIPRAFISSFFVALLLLPALLFVLSLDAVFSSPLASLNSTHPYALLSGNVTSSSLVSNLAENNAEIVDSAHVLNGLPFLPSAYLKDAISSSTLTSSETPTDPILADSSQSPALASSSVSAETLSSSILLQGNSLDSELPIYGTFDRVLTPTYAYYLLTHIEELAENSNTTTPAVTSITERVSALLPKTSEYASSDFRRQLYALVGANIIERYALVLPSEPTELSGAEETTNPLTQEESSVPSAQAEPTDLSAPDFSTQDSELSSNVTPGEKAFEFYVSYRVAGISPVYTSLTSITFGRTPLVDPGFYAAPIRLGDEQSALDLELSRGAYLKTDSPAFATLSAEAIRTQELPIASFASSTDLARFSRAHTDQINLATTITSNDSSALYLGELGSNSMGLLTFRVISIVLLTLYLLLVGIFIIIIYNSAKKSFARRNAKTFALLHAVRATALDTRLICLPFRFLLLVFTFAWLAGAIFFLYNPLLSKLSTIFQAVPVTLFLWDLTPTFSAFAFSFFANFLVVAIILLWLISGLRTRSATSMQKISKYLES